MMIIVNVSNSWIWPNFRCMHFFWQFLLSISFSDWLIFCSKNLILRQKKKWKWQKHNFLMKNKQKKCQKSICKHKKHSSLWTRPTNPWCNMLQALDTQRKKLSVERCIWQNITWLFIMWSNVKHSINIFL